MRVKVDQTGDEDMKRQIHRGCGIVGLVRLVRWQQRDDATIADDYRVALQHAGRIDRDDPAGGDDQVYSLWRKWHCWGDGGRQKSPARAGLACSERVADAPTSVFLP